VIICPAMLRKDLQAAGIPYRDASDRVADFHTLRHTFITRLARSGVVPAVAKSLARHSGPTLTMDHPGWAPWRPLSRTRSLRTSGRRWRGCRNWA